MKKASETWHITRNAFVDLMKDKEANRIAKEIHMHPDYLKKITDVFDISKESPFKGIPITTSPYLPKDTCMIVYSAEQD